MQEPEYSSRNDSMLANDTVIWSIGRIRNTGFRDVNVDETANEIVVRIVTSVIEHPLNEVSRQCS